MTAVSQEPAARRHDLDALRAVAMLLGIALHVALSFVPGIWVVQDSQENLGFGLFISSVHGFRMPLFFLISGFFTAMLWRKRGLAALIKQRSRRVLLPCLIGLVTIVPLTLAAFILAAMSKGPAKDVPVDHWRAAIKGDLAALERHLAAGVTVNAVDPVQGTSLLTKAAMYDRKKAVKFLLAQGADVNLLNRDGGSALHAAALLGRADIVKLLLENGADIHIRDHRGKTAQEMLLIGWWETRFMASLLRVWSGQKEVMEGRVQAEEHFVAHGAPGKYRGEPAAGFSQLIHVLMLTPVFHHLWFLWFLCWLVAAFALYARVADARGWKCSGPAWLVAAPGRYFWLIPLTLIPQWYMGGLMSPFGPDTSMGLLPMPHVLAYYAIFFAFGVLYYDHESVPLGARWKWTLPLLLLLVYPLALDFATGSFGLREKLVSPQWYRPLGSLLQVIFAWGMTFACIGLFRSVFHGESRVWRYVSDSSYWLYVVHLPLVLFAQYWVRDWAVPSLIKFLLISVGVTGVLLLSYQYMVRYTWIGRMLNGPRERPVTASAPAEPKTV